MIILMILIIPIAVLYELMNNTKCVYTDPKTASARTLNWLIL